MRIGLKPTSRDPTPRAPAGETRCNPQSGFQKIPSLEFQKNRLVPGQLPGTMLRPHERALGRLSQHQSPVLSSEPHRRKERCAGPRFLIKLSCRPCRQNRTASSSRTPTLNRGLSERPEPCFNSSGSWFISARISKVYQVNLSDEDINDSFLCFKGFLFVKQI